MSAVLDRPTIRRPTGAARSRIQGWNLVLAAGALFAMVLVVANIVVFATRVQTAPRCPRESICLPPSSVAGAIGQRWTSPTLGYSFEYSSAEEKVNDGAVSTDVHLSVLGAPFDAKEAPFHPDIWITGYPVSRMTAENAFRKRLADLKDATVDLVPDDSSFARVPSPSLGFEDAIGGSYVGSLPTPTRVAIMAVSAGRSTVVFSFKVAGEGLTDRAADAMWGLGDLIVDTFRFS